MSGSQNIYDLCAKYLAGGMTSEEEILFMEKVKGNKLYEEVLHNETALKNAVLENSLIDFRSKMADYTIKRARFKKAGYISSAVAVIMVACVLLFMHNNPTQIVDKITDDTETATAYDYKKTVDSSITENPFVPEIALNKTNKKKEIEKDPIVEKTSKLDKNKKSDENISKRILPKKEIKKENKETVSAQIEKKTPVSEDIKKVIEEKACKTKPELDFEIKDASFNEENGSIVIASKNNDLMFSLHDSLDFRENNTFEYLAAGDYSLYIKDTDNCIYKETIEVPYTLCSENKDIVYNTDFDSEIRIEINTQLKGSFEVFDRSQQNIFSHRFDIYEEIDLDENIFTRNSSNYYKLIVTYEKEVCTYSITVVR